MSAIPSNPLDPLAGVTRNTVSDASNGFDNMSSEDFLEIIFAELTNQDPLQPNDTQALLDQISTIRAIESDIELGDRLEEIARQGELTSAGSLVGNFVAGNTNSGLEVVGFVDSVSVTRDGLFLNLGTGFTIALENVSEIVDPALLEAPAPEETPTNGPPLLRTDIEDQTVVAGDKVGFTFPSDVFIDPDPADELTYSAAQVDGSSLPSWMVFRPDDRRFVFEPGVEDLGSYTIRVTARDPAGASVDTTFRVHVQEFVDDPGGG